MFPLIKNLAEQTLKSPEQTSATTEQHPLRYTVTFTPSVQPLMSYMAYELLQFNSVELHFSLCCLTYSLCCLSSHLCNLYGMTFFFYPIFFFVRNRFQLCARAFEDVRDRARAHLTGNIALGCERVVYSCNPFCSKGSQVSVIRTEENMDDGYTSWLH